MKAAVGGVLFALALGCHATDEKKQEVDLGFMRGYTKNYDGCSVAWSERTGTFLKSGKKCSSLSLDRLADDAVADFRSIRETSSATSFSDYYAQAGQTTAEYTEQEASLAALEIWRAGCSDFKGGLNAGSFQGWLRLGNAEKDHPGIKKTAVTSLYMDGWNTARNLNGAINCGEIAITRAGDYTSGIDIRK